MNLPATFVLLNAVSAIPNAHRLPLQLGTRPAHVPIVIGRHSNSQVLGLSPMPNAERPKEHALEIFNSNKNEPDVCDIDPRLTIDSNRPLQDILRNFCVTLTASVGLSLVLPMVKQIGLVGRVSPFNVVQSLKAIAPIVTFTVNAPALLEFLFQKLPYMSAMNNTTKLFLLASIKHAWVWPHESRLNALSMGGKTGNAPVGLQLTIRKLSHGCREAALIKCVGDEPCHTPLEKFKAYLTLALIQTVFDRKAFPTSIPLPYTIVSRFLYLMFVKEVIDESKRLVEYIMDAITLKSKPGTQLRPVIAEANLDSVLE